MVQDIRMKMVGTAPDVRGPLAPQEIVYVQDEVTRQPFDWIHFIKFCLLCAWLGMPIGIIAVGLDRLFGWR